jgi:cytochrome P450
MSIFSQASVSSDELDIQAALSNDDKKSIREYQKRVGKPDIRHIPGGDGLPFFGHFFPFISDVHGWFDAQYKQFGPVFKFKSPIIDAVVLIGPEANKLAFQNDGKIFSNFLAWNPTLDNLFPDNLLQRDFNDHKVQRKTLQSAFKRPAIEGHMELMNPMLKSGLAQWPKNTTIRSMDYIKSLLLDTGASVFLGAKTGSNTENINKAFVDIVAGTADPIRRKEIWFSPYAKGLRGNKLISDYIFDNIDEKRRVETRDMFSHLCHLRDDSGNLIDNSRIRDHLLFLLFAAHDTTTSALSAVLFALASNLEWQEELREEINSLGREHLEFDDIDKMEKTGWTISEALRMYPALHSMPRYALREFEFAGHRIPANSNILVSGVMSHFMTEYWSDPYTFDPERFSPEREEHKKDFYQYIPFGGGAHKCLGMHFSQVQAKMFLFYLLKSNKVIKDPSMTKYKVNRVPLAFPTDGLPLTFVPI